mgnify:CR=1 FL=1
MTFLLAFTALPAGHSQQRARCSRTGRFVRWALAPSLRVDGVAVTVAPVVTEAPVAPVAAEVSAPVVVGGDVSTVTAATATGLLAGAVAAVRGGARRVAAAVAGSARFLAGRLTRSGRVAAGRVARIGLALVLASALAVDSGSVPGGRVGSDRVGSVQIERAPAVGGVPM